MLGKKFAEKEMRKALRTELQSNREHA